MRLEILVVERAGEAGAEARATAVASAGGQQTFGVADSFKGHADEGRQEGRSEKNLELELIGHGSKNIA